MFIIYIGKIIVVVNIQRIEREVMNKKGITLVELIAVITLIAIISLISFPVIKSLQGSNSKKQYETYEELMVEYAKTLSVNKYKGQGYICLSDLKIKKMSDSMNCSGYVLISNYKAYLKCSANEEVLYTTSGYSNSYCS